MAKKEEPMALAVRTPAEIVAYAIQEKADPVIMEKMLELYERWDAMEAKKAFVVAMNQFREECPPVLAKTKSAGFEGKGQKVKYKWTPLDQIVEVVKPLLSKHGLSQRWASNQQQNVVQVSCIVEHVKGHSEHAQLTGPHDTSGAKNPVQAVGSTVTYLMRYTLLQILGLATADMDDEDDQQQTPKGKKPTKAQQSKLLELSKSDFLPYELYLKATKVLAYCERGARPDIQAVIDECEAALAAAEPPEREPGT